MTDEAGFREIEVSRSHKTETRRRPFHGVRLLLEKKRCRFPGSIQRLPLKASSLRVD